MKRLLYGVVSAASRRRSGVYLTRIEAEDACTEFVRSHGDSFRAEYEDCIIELVLEEHKAKLDA